LNYARRRQYRRMSRAGTAAVESAAAVLLALVIASVGAISIAGLLLLTSVGLGLYTRHWLRLAARSKVGAQSEDEVRRVLAALKAEGWRIRHGLRWRVGETSTRWRWHPAASRSRSRRRRGNYDERHRNRVRD
jgi:hypothetical protein